MASSIWKAQPDTEKSKLDKICAGCEYEPATLVCGKCHCTRYCKKECHKRHCVPDPLYFMKEGDSFPLPSYRDYNAAEKESYNMVYTLQPGTIKSPQTDYRNVLCTLITPTEQHIVDMLLALGTSDDNKKGFELAMGWNLTSKDVAFGYSFEDSIVYRLLFDDHFKKRSDLQENFIANSLVNADPCRGKFLVIKCPAYNKDGENPYANLISFPKSELVDMMAWRVYVGSHGHLSSRMFRENMRRREMKDVMDELGFQIL